MSLHTSRGAVPELWCWILSGAFFAKHSVICVDFCYIHHMIFWVRAKNVFLWYHSDLDLWLLITTFESLHPWVQVDIWNVLILELCCSQEWDAMRSDLLFDSPCCCWWHLQGIFWVCIKGMYTATIKKKTLVNSLGRSQHLSIDNSRSGEHCPLYTLNEFEHQVLFV